MTTDLNALHAALETYQFGDKDLFEALDKLAKSKRASRIDKARIRTTGERLTQPGMLALVYSRQHEADEYRRYLEYLIDAGFFEGEIEQHELEDMQGVFGLKAFRVAIRRTESVDVAEEDRGPALMRAVEEIATTGGAV